MASASASPPLSSAGHHLPEPPGQYRSPVSRPCFKVASKSALQSRLWESYAMVSFARALLSHGTVLIIPRSVGNQVTSWFGAMPLSSSVVSDARASTTEVALLVAIPSVKHSSDTVEDSQPGTSTSPNTPSSAAQLSSRNPPGYTDSKMYSVLQGLANADFVGAPNECFTPFDHYLRKVQLWQDANHPFIIEVHTGIEYFAQIRPDLRIVLSIGVQSASDRGCVTLHDFVYAGKELNPESLVDRLGLRSEPTMDVLRDFLDEAVKVLAGPNMTLIHAVSFFCLNGLRYAKVELCRNKKAYMEETGDVSYIRRAKPAYEDLSVCNMPVVAEAMRTVFDNDHEENVRKLFEGQFVPLAQYMKYDLAKAARVIPHRYAVNRRRYAGILAQRKLHVPTARDAIHKNVKATNRIGAVGFDRRVVARQEWMTLVLLAIVSVVLGGVAAYLVSLDSEVNAAEIVTTGLAVLTGLMISLPQLYVSVQGGEYSLGDFYRGCVPMTSAMRRHGEGFLKECVSKGVDVEPHISGRYGCFLMLLAHGSCDVGPVQIKDLDDRWDYGLNEEGELCIRYRYKVGLLQVLQSWRQESGYMWKWWHCAVTNKEIKKGIRTAEVKELLGGGEIG